MKKLFLSLILISALILPAISMADEDPGEIPNVAVKDTVKNVGDIVFYILILGAFVSILVSAFQFLTAAGDPEKVASARNYLIYALIAIVVGVLARGIVAFVVKALSPGTTVPL